MIFTNESGEKFEECLVDSRPEHIVIRPIKQEPKWTLGEPFRIHKDRIDMTLKLNTTEGQAQLIKEAVEALMEWINSDTKTFQWVKCEAEEARQSMKENQ